VRWRLSRVPGLTDLTVGGEQGRHEIEVAVSGERAAQYGLNSSAVARTVATFFRGRPLARYRGPEGEVEVQARLAAEDRQSLDQLKRVPLLGGAGQEVPLGAVAEFRTVETPSAIQRQQRRSVATVEGNTTSNRGGEIRKAVTREMSVMSFPPGYSWSFGSGFEEENRTQQEMLVNLVLALMLVYLVMAGLFESLLHPFAIMLALPFAFVGIAWTSFLTHSPFNLMAQIGLLILIGIVVNNGIVLIYKVHQLRERGMDRGQALREGARDRLRPILMTTATTVLGSTPCSRTARASSAGCGGSAPAEPSPDDRRCPAARWRRPWRFVLTSAECIASSTSSNAPTSATSSTSTPAIARIRRRFRRIGPCSSPVSTWPKGVHPASSRWPPSRRAACSAWCWPTASSDT
jgi:HAE1 family hydrophobic/amphiphilic exporter-1